LETAVDKHLTRRLARMGESKTLGFLPSLLVHGAIVAFLMLGPLLSPKKATPLEIRPVQIVPLQALGVPNPPVRTTRPTPPAPKVEPKPEPEAKADPEPKAPEPQPKEAMVLPKDNPKKKPVAKKPAPTPKPAASKPAPPAASPPSRSTGTGSAASAPAQRQGSARGNIAGNSAFGGAVGLDDPNFRHNYYVDQMLALISAQWRRPDVATGIEAQLHFRVDRSGTVSELEVRTPSGSNTFDFAAMSAIGNASPLPPLPSAYGHDSLGVTLVFR